MSIQFNHLPVVPLRVTSKFGARSTGIQGASTYHKGIDLGRDFKRIESPVFAVAPGTVTNNYWNDYGGFVVIIDHGDFKTLSQHLKTQSPLAKGTKVAAGQQIGIMGASTKKIKGMALHLHFELIYQGKQIDPLPYIKEAQKMAEKKPHWAEKHLDSLVKKGLINSPEAHRDSLDGQLTKGQIFAMLDRITDK